MVGKTIAKILVGSGLLVMLLTCTGAQGKSRPGHGAAEPVRGVKQQGIEDGKPVPASNLGVPAARVSR
ncbi:MAG: hypothetical protein U0790_21860 [Isosphaeraceae bacterium]